LQRFLLYALAGLSAIGLLLSITSHLSSLVGLVGPLGDHTWLLPLGIFIVWVPSVIVAHQLKKGVSGEPFWEFVLRGCPPWMRFMFYGFSVYAFVNFALFLLAIALHKSPITGAMLPARMVREFSGIWMAFYAAALVILYSGSTLLNGRTRHYHSRITIG